MSWGDEVAMLWLLGGVGLVLIWTSLCGGLRGKSEWITDRIALGVGSAWTLACLILWKVGG